MLLGRYFGASVVLLGRSVRSTLVLLGATSSVCVYVRYDLRILRYVLRNAQV